jgi:predicted enzyme related to lactoylglutathione lyase
MDGPHPFAWFELAAPDTEKARRFYVSLFNWRSRTIDAGPSHYDALIEKGEDKPFGGILDIAELHKMVPGIPPHWMTYIQVDDVDASLNKAAAAGGRVLRPPHEIPHLGRAAVAMEPGGAAYVPFTPADDNPHAKNPLAWIELYTSDPTKTIPYVKEVFGWETADWDMDGKPYTILKVSGSDEPFGGVVSINDGPVKGLGPHWALYFTVPDCDEALEACRKLGGLTSVAPFDIPGIGRAALVGDPFGSPFYLFSSTSAGSGTTG